MFYAHFVLAKKGPLARIWLAAHWDKKLTKAHVFETNIESSVEGILQPKVKMALRTSGHLLLGIVRIYSRKAKYLLADCNEAFIKIKMAFRPGVVDLPEANREAAVATITLPEVFHDFDSAMPDITIDMDEQVNLNQSRAEDITLKEDYGSLQNLMADDGFDDMAFDEPETIRDNTNMEEGFEESLLLEDKSKDRPPVEETVESNVSVASKSNITMDAPLRDDGFGGTVGEGLLDGETGGLFEPAGLFDDAPLDNVALENPSETTEPVPEHVPTPKPAEDQHEDDSDDDYDMGPASVGAPSPPTSPETPAPPLTTESVPTEPEIPTNLINNEAPNDILDINPPSTSLAPPEVAPDPLLSTVPEIPPPPVLPTLDHTTLINNEDESFALAPLDTTIVQGAERTVKAKRKRKLIVDEVKNISGEEMKSQLSDTTDIVTTLDLAPPTKRLMHWKETGGVEKLFALPGHPILSTKLSRAYIRHLTTRSVDNEDFGTEDDLRIDLEDDGDMREKERERDEHSEINTVSRKRPRRSEMDQVYPQDLSHLDSLHLDTSRQPYANEHSLPPPPPIDVPNFIQQQIMGLQHPPPAHMIQQMLQTDVNQLAHLPDMMHSSMMDQGPPMHPMSSSIHHVPNVPSPVVSDAFNQRMVHPIMDPASEHTQLLSDPVPDQMQQSSMDKQMPSHSPLTNHMNQSLQDQLSQSNTVGNLSIMENNLPPCPENDIMQPHMDNHVLPQLPTHNTCLPEDFTQVQSSLEDTNTLPATVPNMLTNEHDNLPLANDHINNEATQNCALENELNQTVTQAQPDTNSVFDALNNDFRLKNLQNQENNNTQLEQNTSEINVGEKNDFPVSDEDDDYGAPASVGPAMPEEQMADETYEQFEERILTKRTTHMLHIINNKLDRDGKVLFADVVRNNKRKQVAQKFYTFLVLKKQQAVELEQASSYGDLLISRGPKFNAVYNSN